MRINYESKHRPIALSFILWISVWFFLNGGNAHAQLSPAALKKLQETPCCDYSEVPGVVWHGTKSKMTLRELASYCAPIYWFSPDEPIMEDKKGKEIRLPNHLPFEKAAAAPVVYFQYNNILVSEKASGPAVILNKNDKGNSVINLDNAVGMDLKFIAYFRAEEGLGGHAHDVEPTEFKVAIWRRDKCSQCKYAIIITKVTAEAHGLQWFFNTLEVDKYTKFPMTLIVEEGKHGMCTDKNGDGYFTPSYDVNKRVNDAWGVRDIIRGGTLFTGGYQAWMAKVRRPEHRIFPPLPQDSPRYAGVLEGGRYSPNNAVYELRPFPASALAANDHLLKHKMEEKEKIGWPEVTTFTGLKQFARWAQSESFVKSLSISFYADGDLGFAFVFPFFILKNLEDPMGGGFIVHRMILKDEGLRDFSWMLLYTPSASRWIDGFFSAGVEWDTKALPAGSAKSTETKSEFVLETGIKFRVNITKAPAPIRYLGKLTEFWGFRAGIKNDGFFEINKLRYVLEFGAGTW